METEVKNMIKLKDIFRMFPAYQLVSLADEHGSQLPYGHRDKIIDLEGVYEDVEVLNINNLIRYFKFISLVNSAI